MKRIAIVRGILVMATLALVRPSPETWNPQHYVHLKGDFILVESSYRVAPPFQLEIFNGPQRAEARAIEKSVRVPLPQPAPLDRPKDLHYPMPYLTEPQPAPKIFRGPFGHRDEAQFVRPAPAIEKSGKGKAE